MNVIRKAYPYGNTPIYPSPENIIVGKFDEEGSSIMFPRSNYSVL